VAGTLILGLGPKSWRASHAGQGARRKNRYRLCAQEPNSGSRSARSNRERKSGIGVLGSRKALLKPYPAEGLAMWPVDKRVGNVKNNDPSLIEPVGKFVA
jgi:hypothetical protein